MSAEQRITYNNVNFYNCKDIMKENNETFYYRNKIQLN